MFWKRKPKKAIDEVIASFTKQTIAEPEFVEPPRVEPKIEPKIENDKTDNFVTIDPNLVFSLQDKFSVKSVFYNKHNKGLKTFIFNASTKEVEEYLGGVK